MGMIISRIRKKKAASRAVSMKNLTTVKIQSFQLSFNAPDWATVHEETLDRWRKDHESFGFPPLRVCTKRPSEESRWNTLTCYKVTNDTTSMTLSCTWHDNDPLSFNYSNRELIQDFLQHAEVINVVPCGRSDLVPICFQLTDDTMKFIYALAADPSDNLFFFLNKEGKYDVCQLEVSPDETRISVTLAKRGTTSGESSSNGGDVQHTVRVYERRPQAYGSDFQGNMFDMGYEIPGIFPWNNAPKMMFDTRYYSSRVLIANVKRMQTKELTNYVAAYNFTKRTLLFAQKEGIFTAGAEEFDLKNALMTPDGNYIVCVIVSKLGNKEVGLKPGKSIILFDPDKLVPVSIVNIGIDNVTCCFTADLPVFSKNGRKMAVRYKKTVRIIQMPFPPTLQSLCRSVFIEYMSTDVLTLNVPQKIKDFLQYKPYM